MLYRKNKEEKKTEQQVGDTSRPPHLPGPLPPSSVVPNPSFVSSAALAGFLDTLAGLSCGGKGQVLVECRESRQCHWGQEAADQVEGLASISQIGEPYVNSLALVTNLTELGLRLKGD